MKGLTLKNDWSFWAIVVICILLAVTLLIIMRSESAKCVANPFNYGAKKIGDVTCFCEKMTEDSPCFTEFMFNETAFISVPNNCNP